MAEGESLGHLPGKTGATSRYVLFLVLLSRYCCPTRAGRAPACGWPGTVHRMQIRVSGLEGQKHPFLSSRVAVAPRGGLDPLREPLRGPFPLAPMDFVAYTLTAGFYATSPNHACPPILCLLGPMGPWGANIFTLSARTRCDHVTRVVYHRNMKFL